MTRVRRRGGSGGGAAAPLFLILAACAAAGAGCAGERGREEADDRSLRDGYRRALQEVEAALAVTAGPDEIRSSGGLLLAAEGIKNAGAEHQGFHPDSASPGRFRETLAFAAGGDRVGYEYRHDRYDGTRESVREVYGPGNRRVIFVLEQDFAVHLSSSDHAAARRRLARRLPGMLLHEVRGEASGLRWRGRVGDRHVVSAALASGEVVDLRFDRDRGLLSEVAYLADAPTLGDAAIVWRFDDYRRVEGAGLLPHRYGVSLDGRPFTEMSVTRVATGREAAAGLLEPPEGIEVPEPQDVASAGDASADVRVREVAAGVRLAVNLRSGFHPMFVEFGDFVVAVDASAGYPLWDELPASDVAPGPSAAWLSERFLQLIEEAVPGKPVRYVVLTHHHADHAGGVRAFVAEGATVLASPSTAEVVRRQVEAPHTISPDRLAREGGELSLEVVEGVRTIADDTRRLEVVDVGPNPHTSHMLVVRLPDEGIWFVSDLLDAASVERFPKSDHAALDRWFAGWLREGGHRPERIYTIHGSGLVTPEHLARLETTSDAGGADAAD